MRNTFKDGANAEASSNTEYAMMSTISVRPAPEPVRHHAKQKRSHRPHRQRQKNRLRDRRNLR